jgi:Ca2+-binding EF-hand superfamily protein
MYRLLLIPLALSVVLAARADDPRPKKKPAEPPAGPSADQLLKRFDKDGDGKLSKDEAPPRLTDTFARIDRNGDGRLDRSEIAQMLQVLRKAPPPNAQPGPERIVKDMLGRLDANKDGKVAKDEARGPLAENFDRLDANKDGVLDPRELRVIAERMAAAAGGPAAGPDFDALDKDADGRLTESELKGTPFAGRFEGLDANKDGKLTRKEFQAGLKKD